MDISKDSEFDFGIFNSNNPKRCDEDFTMLESKTAVQDSDTETLPQSSNSTYFPLLRLPTELRLMIYKPLIADGDLKILRTSELVHKEAADVLRRNGILRMNLGYADWDRKFWAPFPLTEGPSLTGKLTLLASPDVQHLELHFNLWNNRFLHWNNTFDYYANLVKAFGGRDIKRQSCRMFLHMGIWGWVPDEATFAQDPILQAITNLTGFKTFVFKISVEWEHPSRRRFGELLPRTEDDYTHTTLLDDYKTVREVLEVTLAPAILDKSLYDHFLEFHPSDFKPEAITGTKGGE